MGKSINKQKTPDNDDNYGLNYYIENYMKKDISKERSSDLEGAALEEQIIKAKNKLYNNGVVEPNSGIGDGKDIIEKSYLLEGPQLIGDTELLRWPIFEEAPSPVNLTTQLNEKRLVYNDGLTIYEITNIHQIKKETGDKAIKWYDSLENKHRLSIEDFKKIQKLQKEGEEIPSNSDILFINITTRRQPDGDIKKISIPFSMVEIKNPEKYGLLYTQENVGISYNLERNPIFLISKEFNMKDEMGESQKNLRWGDNGQYSKKQIVQKMDNQISFSWGESNPPQLKGTATPLNLVGWFTWWKSTQREQFLYNVYLYELNKLGTVEIEKKL